MRHHRAGLARLLEEDGVEEGLRKAFLDALVAHGETGGELHPMTRDRERALLVYAIALTKRPAEMVQTHVEALRAAGLDDGEILDLNQVTAYFAYVNRVADGLGVELESWHLEGDER